MIVNWSLQAYTDTAANLNARATPILEGQLAIETDTITTTPKFKIGDGVSLYSALPYFYGGALSAQNLSNVLSVGRTTGGNNMTLTTGDKIFIGSDETRHIEFDNVAIELHNSNSSAIVSVTDTGYLKVNAIQYMPNLTASRLLSLDANKEVVNETGTGFLKLTSGAISYSTSVANTGAFGVLYADLENNVSTTIGLLSDSTGTGTNTWYYPFIQYLATTFTGFTVRNLAFNATSQRYDAPTYLSGTATTRYWTNTTAGGLKIENNSDVPSLTGDLDLRIHLAATSYASGATQYLISRWGSGTALNKTFRFVINSTGSLILTWTADGTNNVSATATATLASVGITAGADIWLRATLDVDNGAAGNSTRFYYSNDGSTWTQIGSTVTNAGTTSIYSNAGVTQKYEIGTASTTNGLAGKIYQALILDGIDGQIVSPYTLDSYTPYFGVANTGWTGNPILTSFQGAISGANISYLNDSTRVKYLIPYDRYSLTILSCSHNDTTSIGATYTASWDTLLTAVRSKNISGGVALTTQNPQTSPVLWYNIEGHAKRRGQLIQWANRNDISVSDAWRDFLTYSIGTVVSADGVHPTAAGYTVWLDNIKNSFNNRI